MKLTQAQAKKTIIHQFEKENGYGPMAKYIEIKNIDENNINFSLNGNDFVLPYEISLKVKCSNIYKVNESEPG